MDDQTQFEELLAKFLQADLDRDEMNQLGDFIRSSNDRRQQYVDHCQMHAMLVDEHGLLSAVVAPTLTSRIYHFATSKPGLALATAASLVLAVFLSVGGSSPSRGDNVAKLTKGIGARFAYGIDGAKTIEDGAHLPSGEYQLESGVIELLYDSGAAVVLEGPAEFKLVDTNTVQIMDGRLAAHVPEKAIGFRVDTIKATVIDLGTEFAVSAHKDRESEVHVFEGEVRVELHTVNGVARTPLSLTAGKAARVDNLTGLPSGIELNEEEFLRSLFADDTSYSRAVMSLEPAVYYRMEPFGDGLKLFDSSPARAHATVVPGLANEPVWAPGKVGVAIKLGGPAVQSYAYAPKYPQSTNGELSVVTWVYAHSRPRWASIAKNWAELDSDFAYHAGQIHFGLYDDHGGLEAHIATGPLEEVFVRDPDPLPLRQWIHVAVVVDGRSIRLYRDGKEIDQSTYEEHVYDPALKTLAIGTKLGAKGYAQANPGWATWDGRLDELAVFNSALTAEQIRELYRLSGPGPVSDTVKPESRD